MEHSTQVVLNQIKELKNKHLPGNWAEQAAPIMKKKPGTIRAYARGDRGIRKGQHIQLLKALRIVHAQHEESVNKLIQKQTA